MMKLVLENFGRCKETLVEAFKSQDYEDEGFLELDQLQEAITSIKNDLDSSVLDFMLFYAFDRSESHKLI